MADKGTIIVTGANGGLGSALAEHIASKPEFLGHHGIYLVRDASAAPALTAALSRGSASHKQEVASLDLTNLGNVRQVAQHINSRVSAGQIPPIRALILNAGFLDFGKQKWTSDGFDVTFAANYLGHWLLKLLLLQSMDKEAGRIVVIGSQTHELTEGPRCSPSDPRNARSKAFEDKYKQLMGTDEASVEAVAKGAWASAKEDPSFRSGLRRYGASKLCLLMMMYELQRRLDKDANLKNISVLGVDPGTMMTSLPRLAPWAIRVLIFGVIYPVIAFLFPNGPVRTPQRSGADVLEAAFGSGLGAGDGLPKALYFNGREPMETSPEARDSQKRELVWKETVKYTRLVEGETILGDWQ
ncbi:short-chain dehydrogenase, putative [Metarhizium acridum CQMa 102]|uniref:Short-chain dehydrogenase, putative n=1 Tax=Metarhizium acridum (strain CQMa 102) TaxID=655827 RepID=E9EAP8_METAQ|nr:short-chain dehydrogenase, putative [Metarhizium acridum CQMa 102]EFY87048.1 short-chain dehydrogenase, putative [Metarhizium acridum CQMa 102]